MYQVTCGDVIPASAQIWTDTPQDIQLQRSSANCLITVSLCISMVSHSRETEGEGTQRNSFLNSVGDYWVWYLRQQEAGLSSQCFSIPMTLQFSQGSEHVDLFLLSTMTWIWPPGRGTQHVCWDQLDFQAAGKSSTSAVSSMAWETAPHRASGDTESQNHRMVGVGRDLCGSYSPTPLPKLSHLEQAAQDPIQASLQYLQRRRLHNLPGQPVPVLCHPQSEEVLPQVQTELPMLQFVPVAPCLVTGHHWKELGLIILTPIPKWQPPRKDHL